METCEKAGAYWALLHLVLTLPDVCAALEEDPSAPESDRYVEWCDENFSQNPNVSSGDRYQIRNAALHQGSTLTANQTANSKKRTRYSSVSFVRPRATQVEVHQNVSADGKNLTLDVSEMAKQTRQAMESWFVRLQSDPNRNARVEQNLHKLVRLQTKTSHVPLVTDDGSEIVTNDGSTISVTVMHQTMSSTGGT